MVRHFSFFTSHLSFFIVPLPRFICVRNIEHAAHFNEK